MHLTFHYRLQLLLHKMGTVSLVYEWEHIANMTTTLVLLSAISVSVSCMHKFVGKASLRNSIYLCTCKRRRMIRSLGSASTRLLDSSHSFFLGLSMTFLVFKYKVTKINYFHYFPVSGDLLFTVSLSTSRWQWPWCDRHTTSLHYIERDDYINKPLCPLMKTTQVPLGMLL